MPYYAQINQENIVFAITESVGEIIQADMISIDSFDAALVGKRRVGNSWEDVAPIASPMHITVGALYDRFGAEKWNILSSTDPAVQALIKDSSVRKFIDLSRTDLLQGLQMIQSKGFNIDPNKIVSDPIQADEKP